jgi:hypothetical protein
VFCAFILGKYDAQPCTKPFRTIVQLPSWKGTLSQVLWFLARIWSGVKTIFILVYNHVPLTIIVSQVEFVEQLLQRMCHYQHGHINSFLQPMLQRDFISFLPSNSWKTKFEIVQIKLIFIWNLEKGLDHIAENILSYLDDSSLRNAELVCKEWRRVIADGMLWKKLIERKVYL